MDCLLFADEAKAQKAKKQIWYNYLLEQVKNNPLRCFYSYDELSEMTPDDTDGIYLFNFKNGMVNKENGFTKAYMDYKQKYLRSEFWMKKPETQYMEGVVDYTESVFDPAWCEPIEG